MNRFASMSETANFIHDPEVIERKDNSDNAQHHDDDCPDKAGGSIFLQSKDPAGEQDFQNDKREQGQSRSGLA